MLQVGDHIKCHPHSDEELIKQKTEVTIPHPLWRQVDELCVIYAYANGFDNIQDVCKHFLDCPCDEVKSEIERADTRFVAGELMRYRHLPDLSHGSTAGNISNYLERNTERLQLVISEMLGFKPFKNRRNRKLTMAMLLANNKIKEGLFYVIFGRSTSGEEIRERAVNTIMSEAPKKNKKRKREGMNEFFDLRKGLEEGLEKHKKLGYGNGPWYGESKSNFSSHAICLKYSAEGVPIRYDPGKLKAIPFFKSVESARNPTKSEVREAVKLLVDSLFFVDAIYEVEYSF
jgi:hypothetical protein